MTAKPLQLIATRHDEEAPRSVELNTHRFAGGTVTVLSCDASAAVRKCGRLALPLQTLERAKGSSRSPARWKATSPFGPSRWRGGRSA